MGCEWDLMWGTDRLQAELVYAIRSGRKVVPLSAFSSRILRYMILHIHIDRIQCYERSLVVGRFRFRLTLSCPTSQREAFSWESSRPFSSSSFLMPEEGAFRLSLPVNVKGPPAQLSEWRVEFEVLHKFPAAPIYTVIGRSWIDPITLSKADAIDVFSTSNLDQVNVRMSFSKTSNSSVPVNLFRTVVYSVLFLSRLGKLVAENRKKEIQDLDREIRRLNIRNVGYQQTMQLELMTRTIETMNKYIESGSKPEDWLLAMQKSGIIPRDNQDRLDAKISILKDQIESLRNDVLKSVIDRPLPVIQFVNARDASPSPDIPDEPIARPAEGGVFNRFLGGWGKPDVAPEPKIPAPPEKVPTPSVVSSVVSKKSEKLDVPPSQTKFAPDQSREAKKESTPLPPPSVLSVADRMSEKTALPEVNKKPVEELVQVEAELVEEEKEDAQVEEPVNEVQDDPKEVEAPAPVEIPTVPEEDVATAVTNTVTSWWGTLTNTVAPQTEAPKPSPPPEPAKPQTAPLPAKKAAVPAPKPALNPAPLVQAVTKSSDAGNLSPKTVAKKSLNTPPVAKKNVVGPKGKPTPMAPKAKIDPVKAKMMLIMKIKALEMKRKAEIAEAEKKVVELAKKLPPVDRSKFIGLPGPPPFAPKSKAAVKSDEGALPSALAPPPVPEGSDELEPVVEADEDQVDQDA
jgi:hypothetical protein